MKPSILIEGESAKDFILRRARHQEQVYLTPVHGKFLPGTVNLKGYVNFGQPPDTTIRVMGVYPPSRTPLFWSRFLSELRRGILPQKTAYEFRIKNDLMDASFTAYFEVNLSKPPGFKVGTET